MSYRVELSFKDSMKMAPLFTKLHDMLDQMYKFYRVPKQAAGLTRSFVSLELSKVWPV